MPLTTHAAIGFLTVLLAVAAANGASVTLLSQDFSSDPTNYSLPGASTPFRFYAGPRYWAKSDTPGLAVNAAITGSDGPYLGAQNINDGGFSFSTAAPAQIDFTVSTVGYTNLRLSVSLAGMPAAEAENFIRAKTDSDGDGTYETTVFDFKGSSNSAYTDSNLGALTAAFRACSDIVLPRPAAGDGRLRLRLEIFNDTDSANEAVGIDSLHISGSPAQLATAITRPANGARVDTNFVITATADDDGSITGVSFFADGVLLGSDAVAPYQSAWNGAPPGDHVLTTVAWDNDAHSVTSDAVNVTVSLHPISSVIVISVDGMGSAYVKPLLTSGLSNELTTFRRIQAEGSGTLNARNDADYAVTLPNHVTMMTGRGVSGAAGHNWTSNGDPLPTDTIAGNKGAYVASGFDVAHDNGLRTGIWSGKSKFSLFQQSYGVASGAPDSTDFDSGRDKIDYDKVIAGVAAAALTSDFTNQMETAPFGFVFLHYQDPDATGHASGWSTNPANPFAAALKAVDTQIGQILRMIESNPALHGRTAVILTADHGGHGTSHGDTADPLDYTIPFYVWGAGVTAGGDLYTLNPVSRAAPGPMDNPSYTGSQPIRNGDAANLALHLLGLGAIPGSVIDRDQDLQPAAAPAIRLLPYSGSGSLVILGSTDAAGLLVTERATHLGDTPIRWEAIQTNAVQAGPFDLSIPQGTNAQSFFRLLRR